MATFYYGTDEVTDGWERYFATCNALEVTHPRQQAPTLKTLNSWRVDSPRGFAFVMHTTPEVADELLRLSDAQRSELSSGLRESWKTTLERAHALAAKAIILETPFEFTPSATSRALMQNFGKLAEQFRGPVIWESTGVWPVEETRDMAEGLGLAYMLDPFQAREDEVPFTHGDAAFSITERAGLRRHFDGFDFEGLIDASSSYNRAFVLLRGQYKWRHAREFRELLKLAEE